MVEKDLITELERLMKLHQAGVITSEELEILKKKAIENDAQTNSTVEIEKKDTIQPLDKLTSTSDEKVTEFVNADTVIPKIFNEKIEEIKKTSGDEKVKPQEETEINLSHKLTLKRDTIFWMLAAIFSWIFPPVTIFLLSTKKGEHSIGFKLKRKLQLYRAKQNSSPKKDLKSIFKLKKSPEDKLKEKERNKIFYGSVKLRLKQLKVFWIWSTIALIILFIANYRQGEFNRPYVERLLAKSKIHLTFLMDKHYDIKDNYMNLDFEIEDKNLVNYYDSGGKIGEIHNYAGMWVGLNSAYNIVLSEVGDGDGTVYFNSLKKINFSKFSLTFRSPNYTAKHFTRDIYYDIHYELEVKLKGSDTQRKFLCFWSFIPDLLIPNIPKLNNDGSIDVEIEERMYKKITDVQDGNLGSKQVRNGDDFSSFVGKIFITPNNIFDNTSNSIIQDTLISKTEIDNSDSLVLSENLEDTEYEPIYRNGKYKVFETSAIGRADNIGRYTDWEYNVTKEIAGSLVKIMNSEMFNENKNELLTEINKKIKDEIIYEFRRDTSSFDCLIFINKLSNNNSQLDTINRTNFVRNIQSITFQFDDFGIEISGNNLVFNINYGLPTACLAIDGTSISLPIDKIEKYLNLE